MAAAETIILFAAGSLKAALTVMAQAFEAATGARVEARFGPSGLLRDEIAAGTRADVFASANMAHPQTLFAAGQSGMAMPFARNTLCALVRPGLAIDSGSLLAQMLDPAIRLGTSTPKADPSGDYAFEVFARAEAVQPGAQAALAAKALQLTGNKDSAVSPDNRSLYGWHIAQEHADIFLTYRTGALAALADFPDQQIVDLPPELAVGADYGLTVLNEAGVLAQAFALFILSPDGQRILARHGFATAP